MPWNYRLVKRTWPEETTVGIHTAWYHEGETAPHSIGSTPVTMMAESEDELEGMISRFLEAFIKPTLSYEDFEE